VKLNKILKWFFIFAISGVSLFFVFWMGKFVFPHLELELKNTFNWDTPVYWTIGRGIMNGLMPYKDLFDIKGPGIFFVTFFSFLTSGGTWIGNLINFICLLLVGLAPVGALLLYAKKNGLKSINPLAYPTALIFGSLLMIYSGDLAGQIQTESFGAGFACVYLMIIATMNFEKTTWKSPSIWIAAFFLMLSVAIKEPFLIVCFAGALVFSNSIKTLWKSFFLPFLFAAGAGILFMLVTGMFFPYINNYILYIFSKHVDNYGSIWDRTFAFDKIFMSLFEYNQSLGILVIVVFVSAVIFTLISMHKKSLFFILFNSLKFAFIAVLPVMAVTFGGEMFGHHYIFAVPVYSALLIFSLRELSAIQSGSKIELKSVKVFLAKYVLFIFLIFSFATAYFMTPFFLNVSQSTCLNQYPVMLSDAAKVDSLLEKLSLDRYMYLGSNGPVFIGMTTHSPLGPAFLQDVRFINGSPDNFFATSVMKEIAIAKIVFVQLHTEAQIYNPAKIYLEEYFTKDLPKNINTSELPSTDAYSVYFRK